MDTKEDPTPEVRTRGREQSNQQCISIVGELKQYKGKGLGQAKAELDLHPEKEYEHFENWFW